jgi:hypothetical protein
MDKYTLLHYLHMLIPITIILMPLLPKIYLYYLFPYPIIYFFIWLVYGDCPLTTFVRENSNNIGDDQNFVQALFEKINIKLEKCQTDNISYIIITLSIIISAYKLIDKSTIK